MQVLFYSSYSSSTFLWYLILLVTRVQYPTAPCLGPNTLSIKFLKVFPNFQLLGNIFWVAASSNIHHSALAHTSYFLTCLAQPNKLLSYSATDFFVATVQGSVSSLSYCLTHMEPSMVKQPRKLCGGYIDPCKMYHS